MIRLAAVGDVHVGVDGADRVRDGLSGLGEDCQALLLAGDLSRRGLPREIRALARGLDAVEVPVVAVLGNHDLESDRQDTLRTILEDVGVVVLEGESTVLETSGGRLGIAGTIGFGGGFRGAACADFGERELKALVARSRRLADSLLTAARQIDHADRVVALTHYSPVRDTLAGESPELFPFLGSDLLAEAIDAGGVDLAVHGHAHHGSPRGTTPGGVPVRNVARPVIDAPWRLLELPVAGP